MTALEDLARSALDSARASYMDMGHDNFNPMLHVVQKDDDRDVIIMMMGVPAGALYEAVQRVLHDMSLDPRTVFVINDSYTVAFGDDASEERRLYEEHQIALGEHGMRTPLGERFANGDPYVREMLTVTALSADESILVNQVYRWTPVDGWEWNEPMVNSADATDWEWDRLINGQPKPSIAELMARSKENGDKA